MARTDRMGSLGSAPRILFNENDQGAADESLWDIAVDSKTLLVRTRTNADGAGTTALTVTRGTGTAITNVIIPSNVRIGSSTAPDSPLDLDKTYTADSDGGRVCLSVATLNPTASPSNSAIARGFTAQANSSASINMGASPGALRGLTASCQNSGSGTITGAMAIGTAITNSAAGIITNGYNLYVFTPSNTGAGSITNPYGMFISNQGLSGSTNSYAIRIDSQSGSTTNWGLYSDGAINFSGSVAAHNSPLSGSWWNDSTQKTYIDYTHGGIKAHRVGGLAAGVSSPGVANTTTEATLLGTMAGTVTLPGNFFVMGKTIRIKAMGRLSYATASGTLTLKLKLGATQINITGANTPVTPPVTDALWEVEALVTCRTTGASGTVWSHGKFTYADIDDAAPIMWRMRNTATTTINTTTSQALDLTATWGVALAGNDIRCDLFTLEVLI